MHRTCGRAAPTRPAPLRRLPSLPSAAPLSLVLVVGHVAHPAPPDPHFREPLPRIAVTLPEVTLRRCHGDRRRLPAPPPRLARSAPFAMETTGIPGRGGGSAAGRPARYSTGTRELVKGNGGAGRGSGSRGSAHRASPRSRASHRGPATGRARRWCRRPAGVSQTSIFPFGLEL